MNTKSISLCAALCTLLAAVPASLCRAQAGEIPIYKGDSATQSGITLASWGSGEAREAQDHAYSGNQSIKVTTHGRYQGVRLVLNNPVDLKAASTDNTAYLQFVYMQGDAASLGGSPFGPGGPYGGGGGAGKLGGLGGGPGGGPGGGQYGGSREGGATKTIKPKPLANFRIVLVTSDSKKMEFVLPIETARIERDEWRSVAIPVAAITGLKDTSGQLKEIQFFGDSPGVVYLGQVRVVRDSTPIRPDDLADMTVAKNDPVTFTGSAEGGPSPLRYEWSIVGVPSKDPNERSEVNANYQVVGEGRTFKHTFRKSGDYLVTLTVTDIFGLKKPVSTKANVHVTL